MSVFETAGMNGQLECEEGNPHEIFLDRFSKRESIPFLRSEKGIEVVDVAPDNAIDTPVLFLPGWASGPETYRGVIEELYKSGRRVVAIGYPGDAEADDLNNRNSDIPASQDVKSEAVLAVLKAKNLGVVDMVAYSEGGTNGIVAAAKSRAPFRNFVLVGSGGVIEKETYPGMIGRLAKNVVATMKATADSSQSEKDRIFVKQGETAEWMRSRGAVRGSIEGFDPGRYEIGETIRQLKEGGHGISMVYAVDDKLNPMSKYQEKKAQELGIDGFYATSGVHDSFYVKAEQYGYLVAEAVRALEEKYARLEEEND